MRTELLRTLLWKRGWRTYLFASAVGFGFAIQAGVEDGPVPFAVLGALSLGALGWGLILRRRSRR